MLYHFLADLRKSGILRQKRNITVHLAEYLDILHYLFAISLQTAVHVVQLDTCHTTCCSIEELGRNILRKFIIVTFLFPSAHQIKTVLFDHSVEFRNLVRRVLQVGIHRNNHITFRCLKTAIQRRTLSVVSTETNTSYGSFFRLFTFLFQLADDFPRLIRRSVIDEDDFIRELVLFHHLRYPFV